MNVGVWVYCIVPVMITYYVIIHIFYMKYSLSVKKKPVVWCTTSEYKPGMPVFVWVCEWTEYKIKDTTTNETNTENGEVIKIVINIQAFHVIFRFNKEKRYCKQKKMIKINNLYLWNKFPFININFKVFVVW